MLTNTKCLSILNARHNSSPRNVNVIMPVEKNTISVSMNGLPITALVDTGASISCLSAHLLPKLGITHSNLTTSKVKDAVAVGGERHTRLGAFSLPVSFNGTISSMFSHHSINHLFLDWISCKLMTEFSMVKIVPSMCVTMNIQHSPLTPT